MPKIVIFLEILQKSPSDSGPHALLPPAIGGSPDPRQLPIM